MTEVSPERAAYEADPWRAPDIGWEELFAEDKGKYGAIAQAAINASPELAGALARIAAAERFCRALLAEQPPGAEHSGPVKATASTVLAFLRDGPVASPETSAGIISRAPASGQDAVRALLAVQVSWEDTDAPTVGELLARFTLESWRAEPRLALFKTGVYLAAIRAGLIPGVAVGDRIGEVDLAAAEKLTEAAIRGMGQPG